VSLRENWQVTTARLVGLGRSPVRGSVATDRRSRPDPVPRSSASLTRSGPP